MTEQVLVNPEDLEKLFERHAEKLANATIRNTPNKPRLEMDARALFAGQQIPMSVVEAYAEHVMNVYDLSTENAGRAINMWLYTKCTDNKVSSLVFQDDGPGASPSESRTDPREHTRGPRDDQEGPPSH